MQVFVCVCYSRLTFYSTIFQSYHYVSGLTELNVHLSLAASLGHYANMSVQYTAIFHSCKNYNFQMKILDIFLIFAQNIDCGYTLEPPQ